MSSGMDDVIAAETVLSDVDGAAGRLIIRGHTLGDLTEHWSFEEVVGLLFAGFFSDQLDAAALAARLGAARLDAYERVAQWLPRLVSLGPYDALRAAIAMLPDDNSFESAVLLVAAPAVIIPAMVRLERGEEMIPPDPTLGQPGDMVRMLSGTADEAKASALETYLVTVCDHGLNASTFAARVVASTEAGLTSSALAGLCALKGPLHGGAPGPIIEMLDAIAEHGDAREWIASLVNSGGRVMGFGHRIYRVRDPRADALKSVVRHLAGVSGSPRLEFAEEVERTALAVLSELKPHRALQTNVEYYTALLLEAVGFPREAFTGVFAAGRATGWIAHAREQATTGRLIRPKSRYVGPEIDIAA